MFRELDPGYRKDEIGNCIKSTSKFIEKQQGKDGSWFGSWGVCFTYGSFFAVKGLAAAGRTYENSSSIRKACSFLLSKQLGTGGWGETYLSSETEVTINFHYLTITMWRAWSGYGIFLYLLTLHAWYCLIAMY